MSRNYDNWEKLVAAVLRREKDRQLALCESFSSSAFSSRSSFDSNPFLGDFHFPAEVSRSSGESGQRSGQTSVFRDDLVIDYEEIKRATMIFQSYPVKGVTDVLTSVYKGWIHEHHFTSVYLGRGIAVTIQVMNYEGSRGDEEWMDEVNKFGDLRHPNLINLIGYSFDTDKRILVYELIPRASLETHLFRKGGHQLLTWEIRIKVAIGAARALAFLHDLEAPIIHRDIKSGSILLDADFNAKLSNFRLAIVCPKSDVYVGVTGEFGYVAPEYMATGCLTTKCDVYGFGVVLVELISGLRAIDRDRQIEMHILIDWAIPYLGAKKRLSRIMDSRLRGQYHKKAAHKVGKLALQCVSSDPKLRPNMSEVVAALETLQ